MPSTGPPRFRRPLVLPRTGNLLGRCRTPSSPFPSQTRTRTPPGRTAANQKTSGFESIPIAFRCPPRKLGGLRFHPEPQRASRVPAPNQNHTLPARPESKHLSGIAPITGMPAPAGVLLDPEGLLGSRPKPPSPPGTASTIQEAEGLPGSSSPIRQAGRGSAPRNVVVRGGRTPSCSRRPHRASRGGVHPFSRRSEDVLVSR